MSAQVEKFFGASAALSNINNLPTGKGRTHQSFGCGISKVVLGRMLAQIAIVPMAVTEISLIGHDGDEQMFGALEGRVERGILKLEGEIPFKPGSARHSFGGGVFMGGVTISGGAFSSFSSGGSDDAIILNGREVDLDRAIRLVLIIPNTTNIKVTGLIGAVGVTDYLDAELDFSPFIRAELSARDVKSLIGDLSGSGKASIASAMESADLEISGSGSFTIGKVYGSVDAKVSGSGSFTIGEVCGSVDAEVSGSGDVTISRGTSRTLRGSVSGSGNVSHHGTITGDAHLQVSGSGNVVARAVQGKVYRRVTGSGQITVNGETYRPRHGW